METSIQTFWDQIVCFQTTAGCFLKLVGTCVQMFFYRILFLCIYTYNTYNNKKNKKKSIEVIKYSLLQRYIHHHHLRPFLTKILTINTALEFIPDIALIKLKFMINRNTKLIFFELCLFYLME